MALSVPLMFGLLGLVVDIGWAYWREEACKTAAQAAAFASARQAQLASNLTCSSGVTCQATTANCSSTLSSPPSNNLVAGCLYAKANGFLNTGTQLVQYQANTSGNPVAGSSPAYWVRFTVTEQIPTLFSSLMGAKYTVVSARSTAGVWSSGTGGCVYVLSPNAGAWTQSGGNFTTGCGIYDNGGVTMSGGNVTLGDGLSDSTTMFTYAGALSKSGGTVSPAANFKAGSAVSNPVSGLTAPTAPTTSGCLANPGISSGNNINIPAGTYCSGISISGGTNITFANGNFSFTGGSGISISGGSNITFGTGTYAFTGAGAGMSISGGSTITIGSGTYMFTGANDSVDISGGSPVTTATGGAMFYFSNSAGNFSVSGANVTLNAPTSGAYSGFAIWKDASSTGNSFNVSGGNFLVNGIIYMPNTTINYSGGNTPVQQSIVCYNINMSGGNISQPATSSNFLNGGAAGGAFLIE
jgi:Flp pilus assembly protein TadG